MTRILLSALAAAWLVVAPHAAHAAMQGWCGNADHVDKFVLFGDRSWEEPERGVDVFLQRDASEDLPLAAQVRAVQAAVWAWDAIPCSAMRVRYGGVVSDPAFLPTRRVVAVRFSDTLQGDPRPILAYTDVEDRDANGFFITAEIVLNGRAFAWRDDACGGGPDLGGVVAHELGHALGLAHSDVSPSIMANPWPADRTWQLRMPRPDDVEAICSLYPCAGDECAPEIAPATCRTCIDDGDCGDDACIGGVCAAFCADADACAVGFDCVEGALAGTCEGRCLPTGDVCLPASERAGQPCAEDIECGAPIGVCDGERGVCTVVCDADADCGDGLCVDAADGAGAPVRLCRDRVRERDPDRCAAAGTQAGAGWFALLLAGWYRRRRARLAM